MPKADTRLAVYGSLAPGRVNHHRLAGLNGRWSEGTVNGALIEQGWGAMLGYPGIILDRAGSAVDVVVFESDELSHHWARLDEFEGSGYRRVITKVKMAEGVIDAYIYEIADSSGYAARLA